MPNTPTKTLQTTNYKLPTILVTGANGQLGLKIKELLSPEYELVTTDSNTMDITKSEEVAEVFAKEKPGIVIHGAAYTKVDAAEDNPELCKKINKDGTANVARAANEIGATLICISTDYVFGDEKRSPLSENDEPNPLSVYGATKLASEREALRLCQKTYILRTAWLFGELPEGGSNFVETMLHLAKEKPSLNIINDQIGSPTYTQDLVDCIGKILKLKGESEELKGENASDNPLASRLSPIDLPYGLYHFSGTGPCSWYDFACEIFRQTNTKIKVNPITTDQYPQKAKRPAYSYLDKSKIEQALGIKVRPWQTMLSDYLSNRLRNG